MLGSLFKRKEKSQPQVEETPPKKTSFFNRLKAGLSKTRRAFTDSISEIILGKKTIDEEVIESLETLLITADVGVETTEHFIDQLTTALERKTLKDPEALLDALRSCCLETLAPVEAPLVIPKDIEGPFVLLMVGVNGAGKTTTAGKLTQYFQDQGLSVCLAAGDTFRAAAVEQLETWGERNNVPVFGQGTGADSASVIYDAYSAAHARGIDVLIADTAGRLQNKHNLMKELEKIVRVLRKQNAKAPHEIMLVLDAGNGHNALMQAFEFNQSVGLSGITLTKLDGTAKGGMIFAIAHQIGIPIRFIGIGESIDDLRPFEAEAFTDALLGKDHHSER